HDRRCGSVVGRPSFHWRYGVHVRSAFAIAGESVESVSCGDARHSLVGRLAVGLRPAGMEGCDRGVLDTRSHQSLLAAGTQCELGTRHIVCAAATRARVGLPAGVSRAGAGARLLSDTFGFGTLDAKAESERNQENGSGSGPERLSTELPFAAEAASKLRAIAFPFLLSSCFPTIASRLVIF